MKLRTYLGITAVLVATAIPAIGSAQRHSRSQRGNNVAGGYRRGPFYPSWIPGASQRYVGSTTQYRSGGATVTFGPGGGYYGYAPTYYGYPSYGGFGYGYAPTYGYGYSGFPYGGYGYSGYTSIYPVNPNGYGYLPTGVRYKPGKNLYRPNRRR